MKPETSKKAPCGYRGNITSPCRSHWRSGSNLGNCSYSTRQQFYTCCTTVLPTIDLFLVYGFKSGTMLCEHKTKRQWITSCHCRNVATCRFCSFCEFPLVWGMHFLWESLTCGCCISCVIQAPLDIISKAILFSSLIHGNWIMLSESLQLRAACRSQSQFCHSRI